MTTAITRLAALIVLCVSLSWATRVSAEEMSRVELKSGKVLQGAIDQRSNQQVLRLQVRLGSTVVVRSIARDQVKTVKPVVVAAVQGANNSTVEVGEYPTMAQLAKSALFDPRFQRLADATK